MNGGMVACEDHNRYFLLAGDPDALFISEFLSDIFMEWASLSSNTEMSESVMSGMVQEFTSHMDKILANYNNKDYLTMYVALRDMRAYMTKLQLNQWHTSRRNKGLGMYEE
jgi:hypothetical protein